MAEQEKAPRVAPKQAKAVTGKGPVAETGATKGSAPRAGKPPSAASTGPKIASPSVNYRQNRSTATGPADVVSSQQQQHQDKGT